MTADTRVWFITGSSRGFGRLWAQAALDRGDRVAATARDTGALAELTDRYGEAVLPVELDVTDRAAAHDAVARVRAHFGHIDVTVNNAGYGQLGFVEEVSEQQVRDQFDTNVFGALWVTQAVLPVMREQHAGHLIQVSSIGGVTAFAGSGMYCASKWALEGWSQSLAWEVAPLGIRVTLVEPGSFDTGWRASTQQAAPVEGYGEVRDQALAAIGQQLGTIRGRPEAAAGALLDIVDAEHTPLRIFLGRDALSLAQADYAQRLDAWTQWQAFAAQAGG